MTAQDMFLLGFLAVLPRVKEPKNNYSRSAYTFILTLDLTILTTLNLQIY